MEVRSKLWIEIDGEPVLGKGRIALLQAVEECGSISGAARRLNISYRKAWSYFNSMEERLGIGLVSRWSGGKSGGGASLTEDARRMLEKYRKMEKGIEDHINEKFRSVFDE